MLLGYRPENCAETSATLDLTHRAPHYPINPALLCRLATPEIELMGNMWRAQIRRRRREDFPVVDDLQFRVGNFFRKRERLALMKESANSPNTAIGWCLKAKGSSWALHD